MTTTCISTLADLPLFVAGRFPKEVLLRRCWADGFDAWSSREFFEQVRDLSLGLADFGLERGDRVALISESRPEWVIADFAILTAGAVTVPIYPTLPPAQTRYILADSGARVVIVADETQALMRRLAESGELDHLIAERIWVETEKALGEPQPQAYFGCLDDCAALPVLMPELTSDETALHEALARLSAVPDAACWTAAPWTLTQWRWARLIEPLARTFDQDTTIQRSRAELADRGREGLAHWCCFRYGDNQVR